MKRIAFDRLRLLAAMLLMLVGGFGCKAVVLEEPIGRQLNDEEGAYVSKMIDGVWVLLDDRNDEPDRSWTILRHKGAGECDGINLGFDDNDSPQHETFHFRVTKLGKHLFVWFEAPLDNPFVTEQTPTPTARLIGCWAKPLDDDVIMLAGMKADVFKKAIRDGLLKGEVTESSNRLLPIIVGAPSPDATPAEPMPTSNPSAPTTTWVELRGPTDQIEAFILARPLEETFETEHAGRLRRLK